MFKSFHDLQFSVSSLNTIQIQHLFLSSIQS